MVGPCIALGTSYTVFLDGGVYALEMRNFCLMLAPLVKMDYHASLVNCGKQLFF